MGTLYFSIDFEWLTSHIRQLWSEGQFELALNALKDSGCPEPHHHEVIRGKLKMVGINEGHLEPDDWQPDLSICHQGTYQDPDELAVMAQEGIRYKAKYFDMLEREYNTMSTEWGRTTSGSKLADLACIVRTTFPQEFIDTLSESQKYMWEQASRKTSSHTTLMPDMSLILDNYIEQEKRLERARTPERDDAYQSRHGWILPNGDFYPCEYWAHDWLADRLGRTVKEAEERGWLRVGHSNLDGKARMTQGNFHGTYSQAQLDGAWTWCQLHDAELPKWIMEE